MQDPIADMLTRIRNGQMAKHTSISLDSSKFKEEIARVLKEEGYILDYKVSTNEKSFKEITIYLRYYHGRPVIERISRISRSGLRVYKSFRVMRPIPGFGIAIVSTSKGVMTHIAAKTHSVGGEIICEVA